MHTCIASHCLVLLNVHVHCSAKEQIGIDELMVYMCARAGAMSVKKTEIEKEQSLTIPID